MKGIGTGAIRVVDMDNPTEWIEIKGKLTRGDQETYTNTILCLTKGGEVDVRTVDWQTPLLELAIVGWQLTDEAGQPWAYSRARVRELPYDAPLLQQVEQAIADANPTFGLTTRRVEPNG